MAGQLIGQADVLVEALPPGALDGAGLGVDTLQRLNARLVVVRISNWGQQGPSRDRQATPLTMQAASGWITSRDPDRPPVQAGARISEYVAGAYAALGALTALRISSTDRVIEVDVSALESLLSTLPYPMLMAERMRTLGLPADARSAPMLGIVSAADGFVGVNCLTGQHWLDVCAMLELAECGEHQLAIMMGGPERAEFFAKAEPWFLQRTVADIVELCQALRIPASPINDGATALECPQFAKRGFFVEGGQDGFSFRRPGPPFRFSKTPVVPVGRAPRLGTQPAPWTTRTESLAPADKDVDVSLPFAGVKVLDLSTFWAGAYLTCYFGAFGADIVKVESIQRPDGHRYSGAYSHEGDDWYERSALWQATNLNKRDVTLDLTSQPGRELACRLAADADVVVENFSPRVMEQFGLDYDSLVSLRLAALEHRRRTGEGQLVEVAQIEVGAVVTAEPVVAYSMNGVVHTREGNRQRGYLQGVYPTVDAWVALSVRDQTDWRHLVTAMGRPDLLDDAGSASTDRSSTAHDVFDELVGDWTRTRTTAEIVETLQARNVPAESLLTPDQMYKLPQLDARGYYEQFEHSITGSHRYPGWPFRIVPGPAVITVGRRRHWVSTTTRCCTVWAYPTTSWAYFATNA